MPSMDTPQTASALEQHRTGGPDPSSRQAPPEEAGPPRGFWAWLRHAFAVEKYDESSLSEDDKSALQRLAERLHAKRLDSAAILWFQSNRHMNFLGSQALVAAQPIFEMTHPLLNAVLRTFGLNIPPEDYPLLVAAFEKRYSIEYLIQRIEGLMAGAT
jgi:hypothetical protein